MDCVKCGVENVPEAKFCADCGSEIKEQNIQGNGLEKQGDRGVKASDSTGKKSQSNEVVIERHSRAIVDSWETYRVFIDDHEVGRIKKGQRAVFPVAAGKHVVQMRKDWMKSRPLHVEVPLGGVVNLFCEPNGKPIHYLFLMIFQPGNYIGLRQVDK